MATNPKKPITKAAAKKTTSAKKPVEKEVAPKKASTKITRTTKARKVSPEERYKMIEMAAYYMAEHNSFEGNTIDFWTAAEGEISKKIA